MNGGAESKDSLLFVRKNERSNLIALRRHGGSSNLAEMVRAKSGRDEGLAVVRQSD